VPRTNRGGRVPWPSVVSAGMPASQLWTFLLPRLFGDETLRFAQFPQWLPRCGKAHLAYIERSLYPGAAGLVLAAGARVNGNGLVLEGEAPEPGLLVVCEGYDPGWRARVDGAPVRVFLADELLVGIPLPTGRHR